MKCLVIKAFIDKETNNGYNEGNTFESDDLERVSFLQEQGFLKVGESDGQSKRKRSAAKSKDSPAAEA